MPCHAVPCQAPLPHSSLSCRVGPAAPFHVAIAAPALQQLVPTRESQVTPPFLPKPPEAPPSPFEPLPGPPAAFPRSLCERGSGESILVAAGGCSPSVPRSALCLQGFASSSTDAQGEGRSHPSLWCPLQVVAPGAGRCSGQHLGKVGPCSPAAPRPFQPAGFRLFPFSPRPFLPWLSLIFLPVSSGPVPTQIGVREPPKPSSA